MPCATENLAVFFLSSFRWVLSFLSPPSKKVEIFLVFRNWKKYFDLVSDIQLQTEQYKYQVVQAGIPTLVAVQKWKEGEIFILLFPSF